MALQFLFPTAVAIGTGGPHIELSRTEGPFDPTEEAPHMGADVTGPDTSRAATRKATRAMRGAERVWPVEAATRERRPRAVSPPPARPAA